MILLDFWQRCDFINQNKKRNDTTQIKRGHLTRKYAKSPHKNLTVKYSYYYTTVDRPVAKFPSVDLWFCTSNHKSEFYCLNLWYLLESICGPINDKEKLVLPSKTTERKIESDAQFKWVDYEIWENFMASVNVCHRLHITRNRYFSEIHARSV